jgi:uncharacterized OB-fold protein
MMRLQRCADCSTAQYPARDFCGACLSDRVEWESAEALPARVLARTVLHHSNEATFRPRLPLTLGLVRFDAGPVAVCFLADAGPGGAVQVMLGADGCLEATASPSPASLREAPSPAMRERGSQGSN